MKLIATKCALCGSYGDYTVIYKANFRESDFNEAVFSARRMPDKVHYQIVRCIRDGLVRSNPVIEESVIMELYRKGSFTYRDETDNLAESYYRAVKPVLDGMPKDAAILEIGCGNGFFLKRLRLAGYDNIFGIEPSADAVKDAGDTIRNKIFVDILKPGIFKPGTFSMICFFQLFDHIYNPNSFLRMCYDLLVPGGKILALNHNIDSLQAKILKENSPIIDIEHGYLYSKATMQKIFEKNYFIPIKVYSPATLVSLKYIIWLSPIRKAVKLKLLNLKSRIISSIMRQKIKIRLGNICLIAKKDDVSSMKLI